MTKTLLGYGVGRRHALKFGALGVAALTGSLAPKSIALAAAAPEPMKAEVILNGRKFEFREQDGVTLGDFTSAIGGFTQRCVRVRVSGCPLTVFFRPDRTSQRTEVVFELGQVFNASPASLGAYAVIISRGGKVLTTVDVAKHYWFSRWRWQSEVRPIRADIDTLIAQNLLPPFDRETGVISAPVSRSSITADVVGAVACVPADGISGLPDVDLDDKPETPEPPKPQKLTPYAVMGLAGITPYMPQTGERADIGIVTESQAEFICTARQTALDVMRAQAEAAGTVPWHMRDETTNAPLSLKAHPDATWYPGAKGANPEVKTLKSAVTVDSAHQPALAYVPYILTGDPYHLEDLQFQANWNLGSMVREYRISIPQSRAFAWSLRSMAQCARITPDQVPDWLLPRSYWQAFLGDYRTFFEADYVNSTKPERARFRTTVNLDNSRDEGPTAPKGTWMSAWEEDFLTTVLGWTVAMGFTEWRRAFEWKFASTIARTSPASGWKRAFATPYRIILRENANAPVAGNWAEAWALTQRVGKLSYADANKWVTDDMTYLAYTRGALVYIDKLKASNVTENLAWATAQLNARGWDTPYKWRIGKGLA